MANTSKVGTKNVLGGFVDNKRILEEFIYLTGGQESINTSNIPFTVVWHPGGDPTNYDPSTFGYSLSHQFTIKTINSSTRTIIFDYHYNTQKAGFPTFDWINSVFSTGNLTESERVDVVFIPEPRHHTFSYSVYNVSATYTQAEWNTFYSLTYGTFKKQIYTMIPYSWKSTAATTPDFNYLSFYELNYYKPPCKVFQNKVAKVDNRDFGWEEIPQEAYNSYVNDGYAEILIPSHNGGVPDVSDLPPASNYEGTHTVAIVYHMIDLYPPKYFVFVQIGALNYYKCLPD